MNALYEPYRPGFSKAFPTVMGVWLGVFSMLGVLAQLSAPVFRQPELITNKNFKSSMYVYMAKIRTVISKKAI